LATSLLEYKSFQKLASTYGMNFIENYIEPEEDYFVVHADYHVIGAETGRTACSSPNKQNIPARKYPEFRKPWIARPGNKLIVMDYSSQEPRVAAYLSQDKVLMEIFNSGNDPYIETAKIVHEKIITKDDPFREKMKIDFLAATYGQQPVDEEHEERLKKFFKTFSGLYVWYQEQIKKKTYVETVNGRRIWINPYSNQCERNALNSPIQGTSADMMKRAIATLHQEWNWECQYGVIDQIHDECILDVPEELAEEISKWSVNILIQTGNEMCPGVPFASSSRVVNSWYEGKG
jgi:DNA polymerase-1